MKYKALNNIFGWLTFAIAAFVYLATMEPTASLWDCGEYIVSGDKLEVGHPPGAPLFMMIMRFFTLFAPSTEYVGVMANAMSATMSALTILFLFWSISHLARKLISKTTDEYGISEYIAVLGSAMVGALAYTFSDTFWFSAVEAEVYATSSLITAIVFWAILKWEECADEKYANRWLILLAYITGLSIGVHLLNLLAVPAIVFVYYFRKYPVTKSGIFKVSVFAIILLAFLIWGLIPGIPKMASWFELPFVNNLGLPVNSGVLFYVILLAIFLATSLHYTISQNKTSAKIAIACVALLAVVVLWNVFASYISWVAIFVLAIALFLARYIIKNYFNQKNFAVINTILLCLTVIILGYGSYAMVVIRSSANTPMDQNNPDNIFSLMGYLNRDQYGDTPLVSGPYYNAPAISADEETSYALVGDRYEKANSKVTVTYDPRYTTLFPRMPYKLGLSEDKISVYKSYTKGRSLPNATGEQTAIPTFGNNLHFLFDYQLSFMYWRYFMWNFAGRQNDFQAQKGDPTRGNWLSGIKFIDEARLGPQDNQPDFIANNKGHNIYYMLPLLLGILGLAYQLLRDKRNFTVVMLLFFFTGIAIVLYLNQSPNEPRERDYAYAGSFYAFAIWIGLGVMAVYKLLKRFVPKTASAGIAAATLFVPVIMCAQNWDDHDRSGRYIAADFGYNYLNSCDDNGIVFVYGDNDTFPLWYNQEVEGERVDMRVGNAMYLSADWYYGQMMRKVYTSDKFNTIATPDKIAGNRRDQIMIQERTKTPVDAKWALDFVMSDDESKMTASKYIGPPKVNYFPSKTLTVPVNKQQAINDGWVSVADSAYIPQSLVINLPGGAIIKPHLSIIDIVANNFLQRPIYFGTTLPSEYQMGLGRNLQLEGLAQKLMPLNTAMAGKSVNINKTFDLLVNKFKYRGTNDTDVYMDETARRQVSYYRRVFFELADALIAEGKIDSLRILLNKYEEVIPLQMDPLYATNPLVGYYLSAGEIEKATKLTDWLCEQYNKEANYYLTLMRKKFDVSQLLRQPLSGLSTLAYILEEKQNDKLLQKVKGELEQYSFLYKNN